MFWAKSWRCGGRFTGPVAGAGGAPPSWLSWAVDMGCCAVAGAAMATPSKAPQAHRLGVRHATSNMLILQL